MNKYQNKYIKNLYHFKIEIYYSVSQFIYRNGYFIVKYMLIIKINLKCSQLRML